jgi:hypothetical protein
MAYVCKYTGPSLGDVFASAAKSIDGECGRIVREGQDIMHATAQAVPTSSNAVAARM